MSKLLTSNPNESTSNTRKEGRGEEEMPLAKWIALSSCDAYSWKEGRIAMSCGCCIFCCWFLFHMLARHSRHDTDTNTTRFLLSLDHCLPTPVRSRHDTTRPPCTCSGGRAGENPTSGSLP